MESLSTPFLQNNKRKLAFYCTLSTTFTAGIHFCFLIIYSQPFWLQRSFSDFQSPFQAIKCFTNIKPSGYSSSSGHFDLRYLDSAFSPMINDKRLQTEFWCIPTWTRKSSQKIPLTLTRLPALLYIHCTILNNHSSSFLKTHHKTSLGTKPKSFSKSTNAKCKFLFFAKYFSCNCFTIKMAPLVSHSGIKPNYISSMSTCFIDFSIILSAIFRIWSFHFSPL